MDLIDVFEFFLECGMFSFCCKVILFLCSECPFGAFLPLLGLGQLLSEIADGFPHLLFLRFAGGQHDLEFLCYLGLAL